MSDILRSVGLDVGTTSTQMIFSELTVENKASGFAVPEMEIARRDIRYRSPVYFTPLLDESHVDAGALRELVAEEYRKAGIRRESVDTGAIIITGDQPQGKRPGGAGCSVGFCRGVRGGHRWPRSGKRTGRQGRGGGGLLPADGKNGAAHGHRRRHQQSGADPRRENRENRLPERGRAAAEI